MLERQELGAARRMVEALRLQLFEQFNAGLGAATARIDLVRAHVCVTREGCLWAVSVEGRARHRVGSAMSVHSACADAAEAMAALWRDCVFNDRAA